MHLLLTGANGYIGLRLLPELLEAGHTVHALVRDRDRLPVEEFAPFAGRLHVIEADLGDLPDGFAFPEDIEAAYFLVHSMASGAHFSEREAAAAQAFVEALQPTRCRQIIYLGGIVPDTGGGALSEHLRSRETVQRLLGASPIPLTTLRASIIVGSGSASFEIIRDLVEKLPVLITPRWTRNRCQPIAIRNVIAYLVGIVGREESHGQAYDIGGPDVHTYRDLLRIYGEARGLRRWIIAVPFFSLRLSSYWLYFMTSTSHRIATALVESMAHDTIAKDERIRTLLPQSLLTYREAIEKAFVKIAQNRVPSSWYNALASGRITRSRLRTIHVPEHGVLLDRRDVPLRADRHAVIDAVFALGGARGWPSMNWAWRVRGRLDRLVGGIGVRRGRRDPVVLRPGDALDFWRVLLADRANGRLILYAEMKIPGEAWLEFEVTDRELKQTATFRPLGLLGRLYWIACLPFHAFLFPHMAQKLASEGSATEAAAAT